MPAPTAPSRHRTARPGSPPRPISAFPPPWLPQIFRSPKPSYTRLGDFPLHPDERQRIPFLGAQVGGGNGLFPRRIALERGQFVRTLHPPDALGDLDVHARRDGIRVVVGRALDVDDSRQALGIGVEKPGAAIGTEMPAAVLRRPVDLRRTL